MNGHAYFAKMRQKAYLVVKGLKQVMHHIVRYSSQTFSKEHLTYCKLHSIQHCYTGTLLIV